MATTTFMAAIRETLREEMRADPNLFVIGEDVGAYGGEMGVTQGLWEEFGEWRIRDAPIAETAIVGCAIGAAITGVRAPRFQVPYGVAWLAALCMEGAARVTGGTPQVPLTAVRMSRKRMYFSAEKAVRELGLPQTPVEGALRDAVAWFVERGYAPRPARVA